MSVLQWVFLVLAIVAALAELHFGTIYLIGVVIAALIALVVGFGFGTEPDVIVFVVVCIALMPVAAVLKRRFQNPVLADFDLGQTVTILGPGQSPGTVRVEYRGARWDAMIDPLAPDMPGSPAPGQAAMITGRDGNRLLLTPIPTLTSGDA